MFRGLFRLFLLNKLMGGGRRGGFGGGLRRGCGGLGCLGVILVLVIIYLIINYFGGAGGYMDF